MAEQIEAKKVMRISVRNLVEFILRSGDIDNRHTGPMDKDAMQEGGRIHRKIQGKMVSGYQAEVSLAVEIPGDGYILKVEGRADGIFREIPGHNDKMRGVIWLTPDIPEVIPNAGAVDGQLSFTDLTEIESVFSGKDMETQQMEEVT